MLQLLPASIWKNDGTWVGSRSTSKQRSRIWSHCDTTASLTELSARFTRSNTTCSKDDVTTEGGVLPWPCGRREDARQSGEDELEEPDAF